MVIVPRELPWMLGHFCHLFSEGALFGRPPSLWKTAAAVPQRQLIHRCEYLAGILRLTRVNSGATPSSLLYDPVLVHSYDHDQPHQSHGADKGNE